MQNHDFSLSTANTPVHHPTNRRKHDVYNFPLKMRQRFLLAILFASDFFAGYFFLLVTVSECMRRRNALFVIKRERRYQLDQLT
ncbi:hypothetical protein KP24_19645 [Pectobacterium atrosepticum]|nr:hypothetical protein EV46_16110 [Pectobacterium atrosepticum]ATY91814.1 hypothetical protein CVS35_16305 [Pectobacterium atrosepticum]KFX21566.1 hypothetical protein KP24_19645 [Pectobacterium atrosepticum]